MQRLFMAMALWLAATASLVQVKAQSATSVGEQYLFAAANAERAQRGLGALRWDDALYRAAGAHAAQMAMRESISHQYAGEPELSARARRAGARFSVVAENVAEAPTAVRIHDAWMQSPGHRANLLDPRVDSVGIRVLSRNGELYAVEDFDRTVEVLTLEDQERAVATFLESIAPVRAIPSTPEARSTCAMSTGYAGAVTPGFIMRYTAGSLDVIPAELQARLASGRYRKAAVGACDSTDRQNFTVYDIAVLLYP